MAVGFVFATVGVGLYGANSNDPAAAQFGDRVAHVERETGGRLGVAVFDTESGRRLEYRGAERFAMCSTFKFLLVAAVLSRVDAQLEALDRRIAYGASDVEGYAPVTKRNLPKGGMTVAELCAAAIEYSDNAAANLLLKSIGGPEGLTRFERSTGDTVTRSDRDEPTVNSNLPGDERDTTSPVAMLGEMRRCLIGNGLSAHSRQQLEDWLLECKTGATRLRAGIEPTWRIGDKTGTGDRGATNNIAIVWPPRRAPCLIAVYYSESTASAAARDSVIAEVGRIVSAALLVANKRH